MRRLVGQEDIRPDRAAQVTDGDQERHTDSSFPRRREIIPDPRKTSDQRRIDTCRDRKQKRIRQAGQLGMRNRQQSNQAYKSNTKRSDDERPPGLVSVCQDREENRADDAQKVDRDREQLGLRRRVAQLEDDAGRGVGECVEHDAVAPVDDDGEVDFPITQRGAQVPPLEGFSRAHAASGRAGVLHKTAVDELLFGGGQETGGLG